jgi:FixJ family two-component response regulator
MPAGRGALVVVVDDDASVRRGLARLLRSAGFAVETRASARDFLDHAAEDRVGCLVLDVQMPGQTGLELQQTLAAAGYDIPIVFITGHGEATMASQARKAGALDFIVKPFDDEVLLDAVARALNRGAGGPPAAEEEPRSPLP